MKFKCQCGHTQLMKVGSFVCDNCGWTREFNHIERGARAVTQTVDTEPPPPPEPPPPESSPHVIPTKGGCCGGGGPNIFQKARNLAHTMGDFAGSGFKIADEEVYNQRLEICRGCDRFENNRFCKECGCFMDLKAKIEVAECPLDKWQK